MDEVSPKSGDDTELDALTLTLNRYLSLAPTVTPLDVVSQIRELVSPALSSLPLNGRTGGDEHVDEAQAKATLKASFARIMDQGWIPRLLGWCTDQDNLLLQFECAWVLSNLAYTSDEEAQRLIDGGAFEVCVTVLQGVERRQQRGSQQLTSSPQPTPEDGRALLKIISQVVWLLRNLTTNDDAGACRRALHAGVLQTVMHHLKNIVQGMLHMIQVMPPEMLSKQLQLAPIRDTMELWETSAALLCHLCQFQPLHDVVRQNEADLLLVFAGSLALSAVTPAITATTIHPGVEHLIIKRGAFGLRYLFDSSMSEIAFPADRYVRALSVVPTLLDRLHARMMECVNQRNWDIVFALLWAWTGLSFGPEQVVTSVLSHPLLKYLLQLVANIHVHKDVRFLRMHTMCAVHNLMMLDEEHLSSSDVKPHHVQLALDAGVVKAILATMQLGALDVCEYAINVLAGLAHFGSGNHKVRMVHEGALMACEQLLLKYQDPKHALKDDVISSVRIVSTLASECVEMHWPENDEFKTDERLPGVLETIQKSQTSEQRDDVAQETRDAITWLRELYAVPDRPVRPVTASASAAAAAASSRSATTTTDHHVVAKKPTAKIRKQQQASQQQQQTPPPQQLVASIDVALPSRPNKSKSTKAKSDTTAMVMMSESAADMSATSVTADQPRSKKPKSSPSSAKTTSHAPVGPSTTTAAAAAVATPKKSNKKQTN